MTAARDDQDAWRIVSASNEGSGQALVFRVRISKPPRPDLGALTTAIAVKWRYDSPTGMPVPDENQRQLTFERALDPLSSDNDNSELVRVATGMGQKEWLYYARDRDVFMVHLNAALANHPRYPLEIEFYDDPNWMLWNELILALESKSES